MPPGRRVDYRGLRWLGHKSIEVTHQIYGHLVPSFFDRARTALDQGGVTRQAVHKKHAQRLIAAGVTLRRR